MPRGSKPGEHRGGRAAGTPNKPKGEKALVVLDQAEAEVRVLIEAAYRARSFLASGRTWAARPANARGELIRSCTVRSWRRRIRLCGRFPYRPTIGGACGMYRPPIGPVSAIERAIVCMRMPGLADLRQPISRGFLHTATSGGAPAFFTRAAQGMKNDHVALVGVAGFEPATPLARTRWDCC